MVKLTKDQQTTLARKWHESSQDMTYLQFRRSVEPTIGCDDAVAAPWCGMWLCIETNGYCHT